MRPHAYAYTDVSIADVECTRGMISRGNLSSARTQTISLAYMIMALKIDIAPTKRERHASRRMLWQFDCDNDRSFS